MCELTQVTFLPGASIPPSIFCLSLVYLNSKLLGGGTVGSLWVCAAPSTMSLDFSWGL